MRPRVYIHVWAGRDEATAARCSEVAADINRSLESRGLDKAAALHPIRSHATTELPTLSWLHYDVQSMDPTTPVLYMHLKGASWLHGKPETACIEDWRRLMLYYCVERWTEALYHLRSFSAVGCNVSTVKKPHFSGNFWWSKAGVLAALPKPDTSWDRMEAEFWIGRVGLDRMGSLHQSNVDHYFQPYPRDIYAGVPLGAP